MDPVKELEERLREAASIGDEDTIKNLVNKGVNINSVNNINGWSALHWAAKRGHATTASILISLGADKSLQTKSGETAMDVSSNPNVHMLLGGDGSLQNGDVKAMPIVPNYLANPPFPYLSQQKIKPHMIDVPMNLKVTPLEDREEIAESVDGQSPGKPMNHSASHIESLKYSTSSPVTAGSPQQSPIELRFSPQQDCGLSEEELVLKIRIADSQETDFIEVELERTNLTFENLLNVMCHELQVDRKLIQKVRKLPNTKMRKDKDVKRLRDYTELELVLLGSPVVENNRTPNSSGISPRNVGVVLY